MANYWYRYKATSIMSSDKKFLLMYLDEVSSVSLQMFSPYVHDIATVANRTVLTDDWLFDEMEREWTTAPGVGAHWAYVMGPVPVDGNRDKGHEGWTWEDFLAQPVAVAAKLNRCEVRT